MRSNSNILWLAALLTLLAATPFEAASQTVSDSGEALDERQVEDTSEKADETLSAGFKPPNLTVIRKQEIESAYRRDLESLELIAPGLLIDAASNIPHGAAITLRGISSVDTEYSMAPAVNVMIDGIPLGTHQGNNPPLFDLEKIEIATGSQSTLTGPAGAAGSINLVRSKPTGKMDIKASLTQTAHGRNETGIVVNLPAWNGVAVKFSTYLASGDGEYLYNHYTASRSENEVDLTLFSLSALWQMSDTTSLQYTYDDEQDKSDTPALLNQSDINDAVCYQYFQCADLETNDGYKNQYYSLYQTGGNAANQQKLDGQHHTFIFQTRLGNFFLENRTGFRETSSEVNQDLDASPVPFLERRRIQTREQMTNDLKLSPVGYKNLNYMIGLYYSSTDYSTDDSSRVFPDWFVNLTKQEISDLTLYSHFEYPLDPQSLLDWGLRYNMTDIEFQPILATCAALSCTAPKFREEWDKLTGNVGYTYQIDSTSSLFLRASKEYRYGGYSEHFAYTFTQPERVESREIGIKKQFPNQGVINIAAWQSKWDEKAETFLVPLPGSSQAINQRVNQSKIDLHGVDIEYRRTYFDQLSLRIAYSHVSADYDKYSVPDITSSIPGSKTDLSGQHPARAPADSLYLSLIHKWPLGPGQLQTSLTWRHTDDYITDPGNPNSWVYEHNITDLSLDYQWQGWGLRLFVTNLFNKRFIRNVSNPKFPDFEVVSQSEPLDSLATTAEYNQPRYTGLELRYHFSRD